MTNTTDTFNQQTVFVPVVLVLRGSFDK